MASVISNFRIILPRYRSTQKETLDWIEAAAATSAAREDDIEFRERMRRLITRYACKPEKIGSRYHELEDFKHTQWSEMRIFNLKDFPSGKGSTERTQFYAERVNGVFNRFYSEDLEAPDEIVHVTCTGYVSPSGAQMLVSKKGWGEKTQVTHAYHMGCYAALPAIRITERSVLSGSSRVDVVHSELCSLHFNPLIQTPEQFVVQGLFADGFIRYSVSTGASKGLEIVTTHEEIIANTTNAMTWTTTDYGMGMTLSRDVATLIGSYLPGFVERMLQIDLASELDKTLFAIHPGGPKIVEEVARILDLTPAQTSHSRKILYEFGNMSSATLPHIWKLMLEDSDVAAGTAIVSVAFGPGLTVCGSVFRKVER